MQRAECPDTIVAPADYNWNAPHSLRWAQNSLDSLKMKWRQFIPTRSIVVSRPIQDLVEEPRLVLINHKDFPMLQFDKSTRAHDLH